CGAGPWDSGCVNAVHDVCGAYCNDAGPTGCQHNRCYTGDPLGGGSCNDPCVQAICAAHPNCCVGMVGAAWDPTCVGYVATTAACTSAYQCPASRGVCSRWTTGQEDPKCAGVDLYVAIACGSNIVPVCNAGTVNSSGTFRIISYNGGSGNVPAI